MTTHEGVVPGKVESVIIQMMMDGRLLGISCRVAVATAITLMVKEGLAHGELIWQLNLSVVRTKQQVDFRNRIGSGARSGPMVGGPIGNITPQTRPTKKNML